MNDGSGPTCSASSLKSNQSTSFLKKSLGLFQEEVSVSSYPTLPKQGSMRSGVVFPRQRSARPTSGSGCSSWPTPAANDDNKTPEAHLAMKQRMGERDGTHANRTAITSLQVMVKATEMFPTPRAEDAESCGGHNTRGGPDSLRAAVTWPTPNQTDYKGESQPIGRRPPCDDDLPSAVNRWPTPAAANYRDGRASPETMARNSRPLQEVVISGPQAPDSPSSSGKSPEQWSTPRAEERQQQNSRDNGQALSRQVQWMTPEAQNQEGYQVVNGKQIPRLGKQVKLWSTPQADYPGDDVTKLKLSPAGKATRTDNGRQVQTSLTVQLGVQRNKLNPRWVCHLMGVPADWVAIDPDDRSHRVDELRLLGNGCVPAQVEKAFRSLLQRFE